MLEIQQRWAQKSSVWSQQVKVGLSRALSDMERWTVWGPAGFQSSYLLTAVSSCGYSMFLRSVSYIWGKESILHPCSSAAFNLSTVGMKATKQRLNKKRLLSEGCSLLLGSLQLQLSCVLWWKEPSGKIRKRWGQNLYQSTSKARAFPPTESHAKANP